MNVTETGRGPDERPPKAKQVHALVKRLRRKLGDDPVRPASILTKLRVGYRMPGPDDP